MGTSSRRTATLWIITAVSVFVIADAAGALAWALQEGRFVPRRTVHAFVKDAAHLRGRSENGDVQDESRTPHRIIHPYIGYEDPLRPIEEVSLQASRSPDELCVLITGGSVAEQLLATKERMHDTLENATGRAVTIHNIAIGGYKQPQQLQALSYLLALGKTCDIVINLDGFNEYDLVFDNAEEGKYPWYPYKRLWGSPVGGLRDLPSGALAWEMTTLEERRESHARFLYATPLSRSYLVTFFWRARDIRTQQTIEELRTKIDTQQSQTAYVLAADGPAFEDDPETLMRQSAALWSESSFLMHELASSKNMLYFHFLQPNQYVPESKPKMSDTEVRVTMGDARHAEIIPQIYPLFQAEGKALRRRGVRYFDLTQVFHDVSEQAYRDLDTHVSPLGNEILTDEIIRIVVREL